jgi:hypothetical protein
MKEKPCLDPASGAPPLVGSGHRTVKGPNLYYGLVTHPERRSAPRRAAFQRTDACRNRPNGDDDRAWRVTALAWGGKKDAAQIALRELLATQKADAGWSDIDAMNSGVYATGRALYALQVAGVPASAPAQRRPPAQQYDTRYDIIRDTTPMTAGGSGRNRVGARRRSGSQAASRRSQ